MFAFCSQEWKEEKERLQIEIRDLKGKIRENEKNSQKCDQENKKVIGPYFKLKRCMWGRLYWENITDIWLEFTIDSNNIGLMGNELYVSTLVSLQALYVKDNR